MRPDHALAALLEDFGASGFPHLEPAAFPFGDDEPLPGETAPFDMPEFDMAPEPFDVEAQIREAVERAQAETAAQVSEQYEAMLTAERENHAAALDALNGRFGQMLAERIPAEFATARNTVTELVTEVVSRILGPVLADHVLERSVAALAEAIKAALDDHEAARVRITGSLAMYEALCAALGETAERFDFSESASPDLSVRIDDSLLETRISEWSAAMEEAVR
jgi:hypothetical protein